MDGLGHATLPRYFWHFLAAVVGARLMDGRHILDDLPPIFYF